MKTAWALLAILSLTTLARIASADEPQAYSHATGPCTSGESWRIGNEIPKDFAREFEASISQAPVISFSDGLALRRNAQTDEAKALAEYWVARSLYQAKLHHIAFNGFNVIASRPLDSETAGVQFAALGCLVRIHDQYPSIELPASVASHLSDYLKVAQTSAQKTSVWEAASAVVRAQVADHRISEKEIQKTAALLAGSGPYETFAQGILASRRGDHPSAIKHFKAIVFAEGSLPGPMARYLDQVHMLMARSMYANGDYAGAIQQFKMVRKSSNELAESLSELSWAYLMNDQLSEAIGTSLNLQAGGLRHTYTPEAPMVMAMALNELCQYPESVKASQIFKRHYEEPYRWLSEWTSSANKPNLYRLAAQYLKKDKKDKNYTGAPEKIASEWVRSPLFISSQEEINLLFDESDSATSLGKTGGKEQRKSGLDVVNLAKDLKPRFHEARAKQKPGEQLPQNIRTDLVQLRKHWTRFNRLRQAAPVWKVLLANHRKQVPVNESRLAKVIETDLETRTHRMLYQLEEIASNIQLIEVEIYQGASEDIIWQNAHPEYKAIAKSLDPAKEEIAPSKVWDWGRSPAAIIEGGEIWEDELGSFKANLFDNCSSKDRYLALNKIKKKRSATQ